MDKERTILGYMQCPQSSEVDEIRASLWGALMVWPGGELEMADLTRTGRATTPLERKEREGGGERMKEKIGTRNKEIRMRSSAYIQTLQLHTPSVPVCVHDLIKARQATQQHLRGPPSLLNK